MLSPQQNYVMFLLVTLTLQYVHTTSISYVSSFASGVSPHVSRSLRGMNRTMFF